MDCPSCFRRRMVRPTSATISGARPSDGSSSRKNPGISHQRAPDRQHLQFAAGERAGDLRVALAQPRKHSVDPIDIPRLFRGALALLRHNKVLPDRQGWKDAAPLRDEADPEMRDAFGAETLDRFSK